MVPLYLFKDGIEIVGGLWTCVGEDLKGDLTVGLGDSVEDSVGDSVGGFAIGDADVTIWGGLDGVVALAFPAVPEVPRGPFLDRIPVRSSLLVRLAIQCHSVPLAI